MKCGAKEKRSEYKNGARTCMTEGKTSKLTAKSKEKYQTRKKLNERTMGTGEWDNQ